MWTKTVCCDILLFLLCFRLSYQIACKNERGIDVDWYVAYKIPKIESETSGSNLADGTAYAYIANNGSSWKLSTKSITSGSLLEKTLASFYSNKQMLSYLLYNDDAPGNFSGTSVGHLKGVLAFDGISGFWIIHSIPNFANKEHYEYPNNALINGQSILCVTFKTTELNEICNQLLYSHPNIYDRGITAEVKLQLDDKAKTLFTDNPSFIRREPLTRQTFLKSFGNKVFISFAKDNQYQNDLYSGIIAPGLKSSLLAETWRRGSGGFLPASCQSDFSVLDIVSINMTFTKRGNSKHIFFKSTEDHSKWAISENGDMNWICIADLNRMESQEKRGGGALCFESKPVKTAYNSIISDTDHCPA